MLKRRNFISSLLALPLVRLLPVAKPKPDLAFHPDAFRMASFEWRGFEISRPYEGFRLFRNGEEVSEFPAPFRAGDLLRIQRTQESLDELQGFGRLGDCARPLTGENIETEAHLQGFGYQS